MIQSALPVDALALMTKPSSTPVCPAALFAFGWNWSSASGSSPGAVLEFRIVEIVSSCEFVFYS